MDAQIKQIQLKPATYNKEGELVNDEYATLTLNIPMDSVSQREAVIELNRHLSQEFVSVEIDDARASVPNPQGQLPLTSEPPHETLTP